MTLKGRGIWRVTKPKRWIRPEKQEEPHILLPNGLDSRCAMGRHNYGRKVWLGEFQLQDGSWVKRYRPRCNRCGLDHEMTFDINLRVN